MFSANTVHAYWCWDKEVNFIANLIIVRDRLITGNYLVNRKPSQPYYPEPSLHGFNFVLQEYLKCEKDSKDSTSRLLDD